MWADSNTVGISTHSQLLGMMAIQIKKSLRPIERDDFTVVLMNK